MACCLFAPGLCLGQCWVTVNWNRFQLVSCFNHLHLVPHICVSESGQHCFGWWLVAHSAPGLCLGQRWVTVNWNRLQFVFCFNHLLLVSHICVSESSQHCFGWWLVAYSAPDHCSGQCWVIVNWKMLQWNFNLNANLFHQRKCIWRYRLRDGGFFAQEEMCWITPRWLFSILKLIEAEWRIYASVIWPALVQTMVCRLDGAKPLPEPMQECCKLIGSELYVSDNYAINGSVSGLALVRRQAEV